MVNSLLAEFLREAAGKPFEWGKFDCGLWLADWVRLAHALSFDPAEHLRGRYSDARSALRALGHTGIGSMVDGIASRCGLDRTADPMRGDIALIRPDFGGRVTGAICGTRGWWMFDHGHGIGRVPNEVIEVAVAWRV